MICDTCGKCMLELLYSCVCEWCEGILCPDKVPGCSVYVSPDHHAGTRLVTVTLDEHSAVYRDGMFHYSEMMSYLSRFHSVRHIDLLDIQKGTWRVTGITARYVYLECYVEDPSLWRTLL